MTELQRLDLRGERWSSFVAARPEATAFHRPEWAEMLCECYGLRGFALAALDERGSPTAGMPIIELPKLLRGRRWASLPFTDACAPLSCSPGSETRLLGGLEEVRTAAEVNSIEIRWQVDVQGGQQTGTFLRHVLELEPNEDAVLRRFHRSQVQRNINRAKREGVVIRRGDRQSDLDRVFFGLQVETRRRLGVPVQPRRFYTLLWRWLIEPGHGFLLLAYSGATPIAGAVFLRAGRTLTYKFGASSREHWRLRPNVLLFWTAIQIGCASGAETFDFGRTELTDEGLRTFKLNWGTREELLSYTVVGGADRKRSTKLEPAMRTIIRHSPAWVCRAIGAALYRYSA